MQALRCGRREPTLARSLAGALENLIEPAPDAVTQFEEGPDAWRVEAYFAEPPDIEALGRGSSQAPSAGAFRRSSSTDVPDLNWVAISQAALPPVAAGRFVVHGSHDRGTHSARAQCHPDRCRRGVRHRPPRHHAGVPVGDRPSDANAHAFGACSTWGADRACWRLRRRARCPAPTSSRPTAIPEAVAVAAANAKANGVGQRIAFACAHGPGPSLAAAGRSLRPRRSPTSSPRPLRALAPQTCHGAAPGRHARAFGAA